MQASVHMPCGEEGWVDAELMLLDSALVPHSLPLEESKEATAPKTNVCHVRILVHHPASSSEKK